MVKKYDIIRAIECHPEDDVEKRCVLHTSKGNVPVSDVRVGQHVDEASYQSDMDGKDTVKFMPDERFSYAVKGESLFDKEAVCLPK